MRITERTSTRRSSAAALVPIFVAALLLSGAATANAIDYYFAGQVFQVTAFDAADEKIADAELSGDPRPFAHVKLFDLETDQLLGEADADHEGIFTVQYDRPAGSSSNLRLRAYQLSRDPDTGETLVEELPPAREGINEFSAVGRFSGAGLRVMPDDLLYYGDEGLTPDPGVGLVFTRVGKVEIPFIAQNTSTEALRRVAGLADFSNDTAVPPRHEELHVKPFFQAPFSNGLLIFGSFGLPGGTCLGDRIDYYRIFIQEWNEVTDTWGTPEPWTELMRKYETRVTTLPFNVERDLVPVGPFTGTDNVTAATVESLYWVNRDAPGFPTSIFYSYPDQRMNWRTHLWHGGANGLYKLSVELYKKTGGTKEVPVVRKLPASCFTGTPVTDPEGVHELVLRVDNHTLDLSFDHIHLLDTHGTPGPSDDTFYDPSGDTSDHGAAFDFNAEGLCDILFLDGQYAIEIHFTAHDPGHFMRLYELSATPNQGSKVTFERVAYDATTAATLASPSQPFWDGTATSGTISAQPPTQFSRCGYIFDLIGRSRRQDGYDYVEWPHRRRAYYVDP